MTDAARCARCGKAYTDADCFFDHAIECQKALPHPDIHIAVGPEAVDRVLAEPKPPKCACGNLMSSGEAKVFTCCESCWAKRYNRPEQPERGDLVAERTQKLWEALISCRDDWYDEQGRTVTGWESLNGFLQHVAEVLVTHPLLSAADRIADLESVRDTLSHCYTDADAKAAQLKAENARLDGEHEGLLAKVAEAWAERDRLRELYIISKNEAMRLEIERDALQNFVDNDDMFGKVIAENKELKADKAKLRGALKEISKHETFGTPSMAAIRAINALKGKP